MAERVVALRLTDPPVEALHWTAAMMAGQIGISVSSVQRIWRTHGLQPHRVRRFKLSTDPKFVEKLRDMVGLYVDPPAHAIVLSFGEKSQIQTLGRNMQRHRHQEFIRFLNTIGRQAPPARAST